MSENVYSTISGDNESIGSFTRVPNTGYTKELYNNNSLSYLSRLTSRFPRSGPADLFSLNSIDWALRLEADSNVFTGGARQFVNTDDAWMQTGPHPDLPGGDTDFWLAGWVKLTTETYSTIISKWFQNVSEEFYLDYTAGTAPNSFRFGVGDGTSTGIVNTSFLINAGEWYFLLAWHDATNNTINLKVNNGTTISSSWTTGVVDNNERLVVGAKRSSPGSFHHLNGSVARIAYGDSPSGDMTTVAASISESLFNKGDGKFYGGLTSEEKTEWGLISYFNLNEVGEADQGASDAHGNHDLTTPVRYINSSGVTISNNVTIAPGDDTDFTIEHAYPNGQTLSVRSSNDELWGDIGTPGRYFRLYATASEVILEGLGLLGAGSQTISDSYRLTYTNTLKVAVKGKINGVDLSSAANWATGLTYLPTTMGPSNGPAVANAADSSGNGNHGTLVGFSDSQQLSAWSSDVPEPLGSGYSLEFDGVGDYVEVEDNAILSPTSQVALSVWIHMDSVDNYGIIGKRRAATSNVSYNLYIDGSNNFAFDISTSGSLQIKTAFSAAGYDNQWVHVVGTYDGSNLKLYVDDVERDSTAHTGAIFDSAMSVKIGAINEPADGFFNGKIDDARIYSTALSAAQVSELYAGNEATGATPVAHYKFDDGPQSTSPTDGDPVIIWGDQSTNRYEAKQLTAAKRPTWVASGINGNPAIQSDGVDDLLKLDFGVVLPRPLTIFLVAKLNSNLGIFFDGIGPNNRIYFRDREGDWSLWAGTFLESVGGADNDPHVFSLIVDGAGSKIRVDALEVASGDAGTNGLSGVTLFTNYLGSATASIDAYLLPLIYNGLLTEEQISKVEAILAEKYGITL